MSASIRSRNPGNTGHRYKMPYILNVTDNGAEVALALSCGHELVFGITSSDYFDERAFWHGQIGERHRCYECAGTE